MQDRGDFLRLLLRAEPDLRAFIGSLVFDPHEREDVFQEVALVVWEQFTRYDPARPFGAWARGIAGNKVLQMRDKLAKRPIPLTAELIDTVRVAFDQSEELEQNRVEALRKCLEKLPTPSRQLVTLRYEQGKPCEVIATELRASLDAIYKALSRLRQRLEVCVEQRLQTPVKGATP